MGALESGAATRKGLLAKNQEYDSELSQRAAQLIINEVIQNQELILNSKF
jgi:hypothetical protein